MPHTKFIIAGTLILGAIAYLMFTGTRGSMVYYYKVPELTDKAPDLEGRGIRISGHVLSGSIEHNHNQSAVAFVVLDRDTGQTLPVRYQGLIPDTFKDNAEVVVQGIYRAEDPAFQATTLLAKCPSKYEAEEEDGGQTAASGGSESY